jgi:hypothetical protein
VIEVEYTGSAATNPNAPVVSAVLQILAAVMVPGCEPWALTV